MCGVTAMVGLHDWLVSTHGTTEVRTESPALRVCQDSSDNGLGRLPIVWSVKLKERKRKQSATSYSR